MFYNLLNIPVKFCTTKKGTTVTSFLPYNNFNLTIGEPDFYDFNHPISVSIFQTLKYVIHLISFSPKIFKPSDT